MSKRQEVNRQIVTVYTDCNAAGGRSFQFPINLWFPANEMKIKQLAYGSTEIAAAASRTYIINCNLFPDQMLASFPAQSCLLSLDHKFKLNKWQQGSPLFQILEISNAGTLPALTTNAVGKLALTIEFIQFI